MLLTKIASNHIIVSDQINHSYLLQTCFKQSFILVFMNITNTRNDNCIDNSGIVYVKEIP